ncbi:MULTISPECIES: mechanosensitive ion channel family protein [unclassified Caballeronia]|uniref:mechanosensitive ion channel domain-containing protein n=1 Tax=unclassified Caballeronia TaxID=2646786 RepID=UPI002028B40A|nr:MULTISPECIES: mechanosensitive ion channel family protein [unclassified Caballeronia]MDR5774132.1 mechanosensitive ion channel family protein [Caballeronia sp. LZ002]MDR5849567.1 mechanosensitive ion channel family protein [Caballeronia sp. LZ003]
MKYPLILGFAIVALDVVVWRARLPAQDLARLFIRLALFVALSWDLFSSDLNPFTQAPYAAVVELHWLGQVLEIIWWLTGARLLTLSLDTLLLPRAWRKQRLFSDVFGAVVFLAAAVAALGFVLELPVRGLVATSGALAIVLGLAIQSTLSDVFAGIVLNTTEPYSVGDWVLIDDVEGKVIEMNWRATHLLTGQGNTLIVPNAVASKAKISNNSRPANIHGISLILEIDPEARPKTVLDALGRALTGCNVILDSPAPYARMKRATLNSVQYEVVAFVDDMNKKSSVSNELFDLCYRHLAASSVALRALGIPAPAVTAHDAREALLRRVSLFDSLTSDEIERLAKRLLRHEYQARQQILAPDTVPDSLSIVHSGVLSVTYHEATGDREVARVGPGEAFGEAGLLAGLPMHVSISTLTPVVLYQLGKNDMTSFLKDHRDVAKQLCQLLAYRQDKLGQLTNPMPVEEEKGTSLFQWLLDKVWFRHALQEASQVKQTDKSA